MDCDMALDEQSTMLDASIIKKYADIVYKCRLCHHSVCTYSDGTAFVQHVNNIHKRTGQWQCTRCDLNFVTEDDLSDHTQQHNHLDDDQDQQQPVSSHKKQIELCSKKMALQSDKLIEDVCKVSSDYTNDDFDSMTDDVAMESTESSFISKKRGLSDPDEAEDEASSVSVGLVPEHFSLKENACNSIVLSMKAECAMLNGSAQDDCLSSKNPLMQSRDELQTLFGRYASIIRIKGDPFLYCQVCMYKTTADDDFRIHFLSDEHWQTVAKMEHPPDEKACRNSRNKTTLTERSASLTGICSSAGKKSRFSARTNKTFSNTIDSDGSAGESTGRPVLVPNLTQLEQIFSGFTAAESGDGTTQQAVASSQSMPQNGKTINTLTPVSLKEDIIRRHLKDILVENPEGRLSYNSLLEELESCVEDCCDIVELGSICDEVIKQIFPSAHLVHAGSNQDLFYSGVQLKPKTIEAKKTPREIGLTSQIFDTLPELISYTGNMADSVPRAILLGMLSRRFNQPGIVYWGPQCNKAIQALYPNMEIRRKGRSKVTHYYGVCLNTEQAMDGQNSETDFQIQ